MIRASQPMLAAYSGSLSLPRATTRWDGLGLALAAVILQYVWRIQEIFPQLGWVQFTMLVSAAAFGLFMFDGHPARRVNNLNTTLYKLVVAIFVIAVFSVPTSVHDGGSVHFLTSNFVKTVLLVGVLAAGVRDREDLDRLLRVFVAGAAFYVLAALWYATPDSGRLGGRGSYDPNDLGLYMVATLPLCVYLLRRDARPSDRLLGLGCGAVLLLGTVLSGSRGGFLALVAVGLYGLLSLSAVRLKKRFTMLAIGVAALVALGGDAYWERISTILKPNEDYNWAGQSESGRIEVWKRGMGYMMSRPLFGVGVDQFGVAEGTMAPEAERQQFGLGFKWSAAHSAYVQIGAETGVFGLICFVAMLWVAFRESRRIGETAASPRDRLLGQAFGALVAGFAVGGAFLSQAYATYLYFALGLLMAFSRVVVRGPARAAVPFASAPAPVIAKRPGERGGAALYRAT